MNHRVFYLQTAWIGIMGICTFYLSQVISENYWISIPLFLLMWVAVVFIGIGLISLCDSDHRLCAKYRIKIENLPQYRKAFDELVKSEKQGSETQWIGDDIPDKNEWLRYLSYELEKGLKK